MLHPLSTNPKITTLHWPNCADFCVKRGNYAPEQFSGNEKLRCSFLLSHPTLSDMVIKYAPLDSDETCVPTCLPQPEGHCLAWDAGGLVPPERIGIACPQHLAVSGTGYEKALHVQNCLCCLQRSSMYNELPGTQCSLMENRCWPYKTAYFWATLGHWKNEEGLTGLPNTEKMGCSRTNEKMEHCDFQPLIISCLVSFLLDDQWKANTAEIQGEGQRLGDGEARRKQGCLPATSGKSLTAGSKKTV